MDKKILVLGIGNSLLSDEGVGIHLVRRLENRLAMQDDLTLMDGGTLSFTLANALAEHDYLLILDAARTGGPPGTVRSYLGEEMDEYLKAGSRSVHEVSLGDLLDISQLGGHVHSERALVGIEPGSMGWGEQLTAPVQASLEQACERVEELLNRWREAANYLPQINKETA